MKVIAKIKVILTRCRYTEIAQRMFKCSDMQHTVLLQTKNETTV